MSAPTLRKLVTVVAATAVVALVVPAAASAHATLIRSNPTDGAVLAQSPGRVTLQFSEPVETSLGAISVLDANLREIQVGRLAHPTPDTITVALPPLPRGSYLVTWRVVSADTHAVHGTLVFSIGSGSGAAAIAARGGGAAAAPEHVESTFAVVRFVSFALLLFCVGGAFMAALVRDVPSQTRYVLVGAALLLAVLSLVGIVCQGAEAGGTGFRDALDADVISDVLHSRFGQAWGIRAGIAIWLAGFALLGRPLRWVTAGVAFALVPTTSLAAHAEADGAGTVVVDLVHVTAAALWAGGLMFVMLALLLERRGSRWGLAALLVPRFSAVAFVAVAVLVSAGVLNAYLEVRSFDALLHTSYGQLVLAKAALVVPILVLGAYNRQFSVPALGSGAATPLQQRRFVRGASAELVILAAILAVTAALVAEPPGKAVVSAPAGPVTATEQAGPFEVELEVAPARVGANRISVAAHEEDGSLANVDEVRVSASLPGSRVADLTFDARRSGRGQFAVRRATFPVAGSWKVRIDVRRGEFDEWTAMFDVPIRG